MKTLFITIVIFTLVIGTHSQRCDRKIVDNFFAFLITAPGPQNVTDAVAYCDGTRQIIHKIEKDFNLCVTSTVARDAFEGVGSSIELQLNQQCVSKESLRDLIELSQGCFREIQNSVATELIYAKHVACIELASTFPEYQRMSAVCMSFRNFAQKINEFILKQCGANNFSIIYNIFLPLKHVYDRMCDKQLINSDSFQLDDQNKIKLESILSLTTIPLTKFKTEFPTMMKLLNQMP